MRIDDGGGTPPGEAAVKTHRGVTAAFGRTLVQTGRVDAAFGRAFNRLQDIRIRADDLSGTPSVDEAERAFTRAADFVTVIRDEFFVD